MPQLQEETYPALSAGNGGKIPPSMLSETHLQRELRRRMAALGLSARELSLKAKRNETAVKAILAGRSRNPRTDTLDALARSLGCSRDDLLGGADPSPVREATPEGTAVSEYDVFASAGGGAIVERENVIAEWRFPTDWLRVELGARRELAVITVLGDSMAGTIDDGDKVIVDLAYRAPSPPGVYILHDGFAQVAKRLEYVEGSKPPRVRILSDNQRYQPYERTLGEINIVGRVRGRWQRL